ncbi:MAG: sigma-70 family RNA polymerase sigma factor [Candidatus Firestonebacteria bacterium]|nr:sigma-70 family RNA polymerase sigma factor [Candidatus Firestonebacteria bacterium]
MGTRNEEVERRFYAGDQDALRWVVETYQNAFYRMGWRFFGRGADAQDFAQDVFVHAFERRERYDPARPLKPWLFTVAANLGREHLRRNKHREISAGDDLPETGVAPEAETQMEGEERRNRVMHLLQQLHPRYQEVLAMRFESGLSLAETAQALRLPLGTVKSRLSRGLEAFHSAYQRQERSGAHE